MNKGYRSWLDNFKQTHRLKNTDAAIEKLIDEHQRSCDDGK